MEQEAERMKEPKEMGNSKDTMSSDTGGFTYV